MIAATAAAAGVELATLKRKHFPMLTGIQISYMNTRYPDHESGSFRPVWQRKVPLCRNLPDKKYIDIEYQ